MEGKGYFTLKLDPDNHPDSSAMLGIAHHKEKHKRKGKKQNTFLLCCRNGDVYYNHKYHKYADRKINPGS